MPSARAAQRSLVTWKEEEEEEEAPELEYEMIPLDQKNYDFWRSYVMAMRVIANNEDSYSKDMKYGWSQAVKGFLDALAAFEETETPQVWIAVAKQGGKPKTKAEYAVQIEMCMTVTTSPRVPFTTHMGIFRSPLRGLSEPTIKELRNQGMYGVDMIIKALVESGGAYKTIGGISLQIHAFAAQKIFKLLGRGKKYMITAPLKNMFGILKKAFGKDAETDIETADLDQAVMVRVGNDTPLKLAKQVWKTDPWVESITDLGGNRPKVAIKLDLMAEALNEKERVKSILDWLDEQYNDM